MSEREGKPRSHPPACTHSYAPELKRTLLLLEAVVKTNAKEKTPRVLRSTSKLRKTLSAAQLTLAVSQVLPDANESKPLLLALLAKIATKAEAAAATAAATADVDMTDASAPTASEPSPASTLKASEPLPVLDLIEVEVYFFLYVLAALVKYEFAADARLAVETALARAAHSNRRTLDAFHAKLYAYYASIHEQFFPDELPAIRSTLLAAHRTATLKYDEIGQATLANLLLRNLLHENLYEQAYKFVTKSVFPEAASNNQFVRYLYYVGKIQAVQLEYSDAHTKLMQSIRKAPQLTAAGFRRTVYKLAVIVQLLMGDVPERSIFNQDDLRVALAPYLQLTNVRKRRKRVL